MTKYNPDHINQLIQDFVKAGMLSKKVAESMTNEEKIAWLQSKGIIKGDYE